jgi:hypothetical protein
VFAPARHEPGAGATDVEVLCDGLENKAQQPSLEQKAHARGDSCQRGVQRLEEKAHARGPSARGSLKPSAQGILGLGVAMAGTVSASFYLIP